jgi:hypothetical protein
VGKAEREKFTLKTAGVKSKLFGTRGMPRPDGLLAGTIPY